MKNNDESEPVILAFFEKLDETKDILDSLLATSVATEASPEEDRDECEKLRRLNNILSEYQEQAHLLDPHLELLITPVVEALRGHARAYVSSADKICSLARVKRLSMILYGFVRTRGYKTVVMFFPHEISDLPIAVSYMCSGGPIDEADNWALRYLILLWLSLVCKLPFDLSRFDDIRGQDPASAIEKVASVEIVKPGIEREGAALVLARFYMRPDSSARLLSFLRLYEENLSSSHLFSCIGSLQMLSEISKSAPSGALQPCIPLIRQFVSKVSALGQFADNTIVKKLRAKIVARLATRVLPSRSRRRNGRPLLSGSTGETYGDMEENFDDAPSEVEDAIEELFELLQDKESSVRWSSAKGLANISERLSTSFADQILDTILSLFSIHSAGGSISGLPAIAEFPWHGATLACAELARRNIISQDRLPDVLDWATEALYFDIRRGSFSIGSNVRDAAAYVIWSLARTQSTRAFEKFAQDLAEKLVAVALFDREVHIRRAASAAFQEHVGRMGLFIHGIEVLGKIDFYSVSIRRNAFLVAAPSVAAHQEYLQCTLLHLTKITLRHWDEDMRRLGAQSLRRICELDLTSLGPKVTQECAQLLHSVDTIDIHGGLLMLSELACAFRDAKGTQFEENRRQVFHLVQSVPSAIISSPRNHLIMEAACYVIANTVSSIDIDILRNPLSEDAFWNALVSRGLQQRRAEVQEAAAVAYSSLSQLFDHTEFRSSPHLQQSLARVLGLIDYCAHKNGFDAALACLLRVVDPSSPHFFNDVEARRYAYTSMAQMVTNIIPVLNELMKPKDMSAIFNAFFAGLEDYTINERGDVGSWIRLACLKAFFSVFEALIRATLDQDGRLQDFESYLPAETYQRAVSCMLKQGVERLDNVRQCVGELFTSLLELPVPAVANGDKWTIIGSHSYAKVFEDSKVSGWNDGAWLYPRATRFMDVTEYRLPVLRGLVLSIGSRTSSTTEPASSALLAYAQTLQPDMKTPSELVTQSHEYTLHALVEDLLGIAEDNPTSNNAVVPVLQTLAILLEGDVLLPLARAENGEGQKLLSRVLHLTTKNIERLKSMQRVEQSMKTAVNTLPLPAPGIRRKCLSAIGLFLQHRFPKIRSDCAEALYLVLQTKDVEYDEEAEVILLETDWSGADRAALAEPAARVLACLEPH